MEAKMVKGEEITNNNPSTSLSLWFDQISSTDQKKYRPLDGVFECKTCNKQFPSFQALGGHRTSHNRRAVRVLDETQTKNRAHECSVCGMEFSIGQALGGHMRRHRTVINHDSVISSHAEFEILDFKNYPARSNNLHLLDLFPDH